MYKYSDGQIRFSDFNQPMGLTMSPENRWVKKADLIPWDELECEYAGLFKSKTGTVAKPFRLALGALLIQIEYGYSDKRWHYRYAKTRTCNISAGWVVTKTRHHSIRR